MLAGGVWGGFCNPHNYPWEGLRQGLLNTREECLCNGEWVIRNRPGVVLVEDPMQLSCCVGDAMY